MIGDLPEIDDIFNESKKETMRRLFAYFKLTGYTACRARKTH